MTLFFFLICPTSPRFYLSSTVVSTLSIFLIPPRDKRAVHCEGDVNQTTKRNFMRGAVTN